MTLLVVEDEARIAAFLVKGLCNAGYQVEVAPTGSDALERSVRQGRAYAIVLLDLGLPDMSGLDVLQLLRERGNSVPVVVVTASDDADDRARAAQLGAEDYMTKPFSFPELLDRVRRHSQPSHVAGASATR